MIIFWAALSEKALCTKEKAVAGFIRKHSKNKNTVILNTFKAIPPGNLN
jgi:hypothetical protein